MLLKASHTRIQLNPFAPGIRLFAASALLAGSALAADPTCKLVADATTKYLAIPTHIYTTEAGAMTGGKPRNIESIYLIDKTYTLIDGRWRVSPVTPKMLLEDMKKACENPDTNTNTHATCRMVRDEAINGEAATLYNSHTETPDMKADTQIWISKSRGLPLKLEQTADVGGVAGKSHRVSRYEYTNVQAPPGVR